MMMVAALWEIRKQLTAKVQLSRRAGEQQGRETANKGDAGHSFTLSEGTYRSQCV